jgi:hypothetical protein
VDALSRGQGTAFFEGAAFGETVSEEKRNSVIIAMYAGCAAEQKLGFETCADTDDPKRVKELLPGREDSEQELREKAAQFVDDRWSCIEKVANVLLDQPVIAPESGKYPNWWLGQRRDRAPIHG